MGSVSANWLKGLLLLLCCGSVWAQSAAELRSRFDSVKQQAVSNVFDRPLYLQSTETSGRMQGDVYALIEHPFAELRQPLAQAKPWCSILILHLNVKYCRAAGNGPRDLIDVGIGRKFDQPLSSAYWVKFDYRPLVVGDGYLRVELLAPDGPMGGKDLRILLEAMTFTPGQSLLHLTYSYSSGLAARLATQAYLATLGHDKVGFSRMGQREDGPLVGGLRGLLERNTMRYHLAIEAYLDAPATQQLPQRLQGWFSATERYALQLHEVERQDYIEMKIGEIRRQELEPPPN